MSTFLVFALAVLIFGVIPFWLTRYVGGKTGPTDSKRYVGIAGWLSLLIVSFGFWSPLYGIGSFFGEFNKAERVNPAVLSASGYQGYKSSVFILLIVLCLIQVYLTSRLLLRREYSSVYVFKKFLFLSPLVCFVPPILSKIYFPQLDLQQWSETFASLFWMVVINGSWLLYLQKSRRVRSTYGILDDSESTGVSREPVGYSTRLENKQIRAELEDFAASERMPRPDAINSGGDSLREPRRSKSRIDGRMVLRRALGESDFDETLWSRCLAKSGSDEVRACSDYWRIKSGKKIFLRD